MLRIGNLSPATISKPEAEVGTERLILQHVLARIVVEGSHVGIIMLAQEYALDGKCCSNRSTCEVEGKLELTIEALYITQSNDIHAFMERILISCKEGIVVAFFLRLNSGLNIASTRDNDYREVIVLTSTQCRTVVLDVNLSLPLVATCIGRNGEVQTTMDVTIKSGIKTARPV